MKRGEQPRAMEETLANPGNLGKRERAWSATFPKLRRLRVTELSYLSNHPVNGNRGQVTTPINLASLLDFFMMTRCRRTSAIRTGSRLLCTGCAGLRNRLPSLRASRSLPRYFVRELNLRGGTSDIQVEVSSVHRPVMILDVVVSEGPAVEHNGNTPGFARI
jgi:hypothetical protein